jgi:hypothetical protein
MTDKETRKMLSEPLLDKEADAERNKGPNQPEAKS